LGNGVTHYGRVMLAVDDDQAANRGLLSIGRGSTAGG
jgi:hypothetical protein